jgi:proton-translocating NADH-quinone oxidoreductase chain N
MVIPTALYYMFAPILMGIVGLLADKMKAPKLRDGVAILVSLWGVLSVWMLYNMGINTGEILVFSIGGLPPLGACFEIDMFSLYFAGSAVILSFLVTVYSFTYMDHDTRLTEYYALLCAITVGMVGVAFAGDMFTMFIFWEMMGIASYSLVSFRKDNPGPVEAGFKYMIMGSVGSVILFFGMAFVYGMAGSLNFAVLASSLRGSVLTPWTILVFATFIVGFGVKSAIVPMHTWLPDAHPEAPSSISALLSGIVIETGLYAMIRVFSLLYEPAVLQLPFAALAVATMTIGNLLALFQADLKRMLAYSSIAQIGYMLIGLSAGGLMGIQGLFLHVFTHSMMKGLAFLAAGSIVHESHTRNIEDLKGIGRFMPYSTLGLFVAFMGLGGVPATGGFISKFMLFGSAIQSGMSWLTVLGVLNSALSMGYYLRVIKTLISDPVDSVLETKEAPALMVGVTIVMTLVVILLGLYPEPVVSIAQHAAESLVSGLDAYIGAILG